MSGFAAPAPGADAARGGFVAGARFVPCGRSFFADVAALLRASADGGFVDRLVVRFVADADAEPCFAAGGSRPDGAPAIAVAAEAPDPASAPDAGAPEDAASPATVGTVAYGSAPSQAWQRVAPWPLIASQRGTAAR